MPSLTASIRGQTRLLSFSQEKLLTRLPSRAMTTAQDHENQTLTLPSSRMLGYATYGPENGDPVYFFHGLPGSRLDGRFFAKAADKLDARVVTIERPGWGLSSPDPDRTHLTWPKDVLAVADHLGHSSFRVLGMSGGGPYAMACALTIPKERLLATGLLASMGPFRETGLRNMGFSTWAAFSLWIWRAFPGFGRWFAKKYMWKALLTGKQDEFDAKIRKAFAEIKNKEERDLYAESGFLDTVIESLHESFRQGPEPYFQEADLASADWPFKVAELKQKDRGPILIWVGSEDRQTPVGQARWMNEQLGGTEKGPRDEDEKTSEGTTLRVYPGENHGTMIARYAAPVLAELLGR